MQSLLLIVADHGPHMGPYAAYSGYGYAENSLPALFAIAPKWFLRKYPTIAEALRLNQQRLLSNYDVYDGLKSLLRLPEFYDAVELARVQQRSRKSSKTSAMWRSSAHHLYHGADSSVYASLDEEIGDRGHRFEPSTKLDGLFSQVSPSRTCEEARVPVHICTCNKQRRSF